MISNTKSAINLAKYYGNRTERIAAKSLLLGHILLMFSFITAVVSIPAGIAVMSAGFSCIMTMVYLSLYQHYIGRNLEEAKNENSNN